MKRYNGSNIKRHNDSFTPVGRLYKQEGMVRRVVVELLKYIYIYIKWIE
jgi:hypothetical protein